ncbi:MAG: YezD family protein [Pirellulales bacterium]|nr:YezD family protein [Pirellulales bacterium]
MNDNPAVETDAERPTSEELLQITRALRGLRFGSVNIVVQDGVVIQIDRTEKRRLRSRGDCVSRS